MSSRFLSSGAYGCVYYPGYNCEGKPLKKDGLVTKLVKDNFTTQTEVVVGHHVRKNVPNYGNHFIVVSKKCKIAEENLDALREGCKMFNRNIGNKYVLLYSVYLKSIELYELIEKGVRFSQLLRFFFDIVQKVTLLMEAGIVHNDLHMGNVLYTNKGNLFIIDFGLSIKADMLKEDNSDYLREIFHSYTPNWKWWPLEYHLITYILNVGSLTEESIKSTIEEYLKSMHYILKSVYGLGFLDSYRSIALSVFSPWIQKTKPEQLVFLLSFWNTWDSYKLANHFIHMYQEQDMDVPILKNHLLRMIHADPSKRQSVSELRQMKHMILQNVPLSAYSKKIHIYGEDTYKGSILNVLSEKLN
jgi:serine/threonine protein kinase